MRELLHPPAHRGPLIAAGALVLTVGVALEQVRVRPGAVVQLLVVAALAAVLLWLALQERLEDGKPHAHTSLLLVLGLGALYVALLRLADVIGADFSGEDFPAGAFVWTGLVEAGVAGLAAVRLRSSIAVLLAAVAAGIALLSAWDWVFDPGSVTPYRWLLLLLAIGFAVASLPVRATSLRHAEQMVNAAGLAILAIPLIEVPATLFGGSAALPGFWELVVLVAGLGLVAYATVDHAPGPAYLGAALLGSFLVTVGAAGDRTLEWWPLALLLLGGGMLGAGLRPRAPLPPEPDSSTRPDESPLPVRVRRD